MIISVNGEQRELPPPVAAVRGAWTCRPVRRPRAGSRSPSTEPWSRAPSIRHRATEGARVEIVTAVQGG